MNTKTWYTEQGDCLEIMKTFKSACVDTVITDPPYGLKFMGKDWDHGLPGAEFWIEVLRIAKPGAMLFAFGGTRTFHRLVCAIEDAGWEIRDCMMWLYGTGFPKSHDISKAIDKAAGAKREKVRHANPRNPKSIRGGAGVEGGDRPYLVKARELGYHEMDGPDAVTDAAKEWDGWGTALKPAWEPIILAMKPLEGTFARNAQEHGVAGLWIEGCRVGKSKRVPSSPRKAAHGGKSGGVYGEYQSPPTNTAGWDANSGRWPANILLQEGAVTEDWTRFFYCAKASKAERSRGLPEGTKNPHPTVKPLSLMRYLCRLTKTPTGGVVFDPFMGSGSTGVAALLEERLFVGIELDGDYTQLADSRLSAVHQASFEETA